MLFILKSAKMAHLYVDSSLIITKYSLSCSIWSAISKFLDRIFYKQCRCIAHSSGGWELQDKCVNMFMLGMEWFLIDDNFCILTWWNEWRASHMPFIRTLIPVLNDSHKVRISYYLIWYCISSSELWMDFNIQTIVFLSINLSLSFLFSCSFPSSIFASFLPSKIILYNIILIEELFY